MSSRQLEITVRRKPQRDHDRYVGYDFLWPDGTPGNVSFDCLCLIGQRAFFDRRPLPEQARLVLHYIPTWDTPRDRKRKRLIHRIEASGRSRFYLPDGVTETVFVFDSSNDLRIREWAGTDQGPGDHRFELYADLLEYDTDPRTRSMNAIEQPPTITCTVADTPSERSHCYRIRAAEFGRYYRNVPPEQFHDEYDHARLPDGSLQSFSVLASGPDGPAGTTRLTLARHPVFPHLRSPCLEIADFDLDEVVRRATGHSEHPS
jgi:hypothetical protein